MMRDSERAGELDGLRDTSISLVLLFHYFVQYVEVLAQPETPSAIGLRLFAGPSRRAQRTPAALE